MTNIKKQLAVVSLAGKYEAGFGNAQAVCRKTAKALQSAEVSVLHLDRVLCDAESVEFAKASLASENFYALLVCVATWSEDHHLLDLMDTVHTPIILHAYPAFETGSLCGVQQIASVFTDTGFRDFHYVYGEAGSAQATAEIVEILTGLALVEEIRGVRIGTIGGRAGGMTEIAYDEFAIKQTTGARIVEISEPELQEAVSDVSPEATARQVMWLRQEFPDIRSGPDDLEVAARYYLAMKGLANQYGLGGLAVNCYTRYMGKVCLAYSLLAEDGIVCGCEGDVNSTLLMCILQRLTGTPVHNTDLLYPDTVRNTILFSHCGSGHRSLAATREEICLSPVRLMDTGVCVTFTARPGSITLADLVGHGGTFRMSVITGEAIPCGMEFPGNPLKVQFKQPVLDICREVALRGMGHHWMAVYGDVAKHLQQYCNTTGVLFNRL